MSLGGLQRYGEMRDVWRRNGGAKVIYNLQCPGVALWLGDLTKELALGAWFRSWCVLCEGMVWSGVDAGVARYRTD